MINGCLEGYFNSGKGLRQGDLMSPLLFIIAMEYLSRLFKFHCCFSAGFVFYPKCSSLKLTHLYFADDLFIFSKAEVTSLMIINQVLSEFASTSGLQANNNKSQIYFSSVNTITKESILSVLPFQEGTLPVKYLGVPLLSSRLKQSHCQSLIAKITCEISSWMVQYLSYTGRLQLIQFILQSLCIYQYSIFIIPKLVIHEIESICRNFLWHGHYEGKQYYFISQDSIYTPKCEGDLGLKRVYDWNIASIIRFISDIISEKDSLWARWVFDTKLKRLSFWGLTKPHDVSWIWSLLLKIKNLAKPIFEYKLGKGNKFHFQGDPQAQNVTAEELFPDASVTNTDIPKSTLLYDLWGKNRWRISDAIDIASEALRQFIIDNFCLNNQEDHLEINY